MKAGPPGSEVGAQASRRARGIRWLRWLPTVGLAMGVGILAVECAVVARFSLTAAQGHGVLEPLWRSLLGYWAVLGTCDLLVLGLLALRRSDVSGWRPLAARVGAACGVAGLLAGIGGQEELVVLILLGGVFAWLGHTRWLWPVAVGFAAFAFWPVLPDRAPAPPTMGPDAPERPSIALIVLDTVRADHTSAYGYDRDTTPHLAALAARGVRFDRAYSSSCWSLPSHASLLTGRMPREHGAHHEHHRLAVPLPTLPERLAARGYETVGFSANPWISNGTGLTRGFTRFEGMWSNYVIRELLLFWRTWWRFTTPNQDKGGAATVQAIRSWYDSRSPDRPFFLFVNLLEAHAPYNHVPRESLETFLPQGFPLDVANAVGEEWFAGIMDGIVHEELDREIVVRLLDAAIHASDAYLGEILSLVGENTVVVVVSDHGELIGEHGLLGHNQTLYEPVIRIPLVVAGPGVPADRIVRSPASIVDVMPTLLEIADAGAIPGSGIDLMGLLRGDPSERTIVAEHMRPGSMAVSPLPTGSPVLVAHHTARKVAAISGWHKRVIDELGRDQTFDLRSDPPERSPLSTTSPVAWIEPPSPRSDVAAGPPENGVELEPLDRRALEALGYLEPQP